MLRNRLVSRRVVPLALLLSLSGCAGTGMKSTSTAPPTREQEAAALQVKLGQEYMSKGELETAQEKLQRAIQLDPNSVDAHTLLAILNERISRHEVAERFYRRAVELKPDDGAVNNNYGAFLCGVGRYAEAEQHFQAAINDPFYKTPGVAFANAGVCARKSGDMARSEQYFRRTLELDPANLVALYELARVSYANNDFLRARAFLQRYEARAAADAELLILAIKIENKLGDSRAEQQYRQRLSSEFPDVAPPTDSPTESP